MPRLPLLRTARGCRGAALVAAFLGAFATAAAPPAAEPGWTPFEASLSASGQRQVLEAGPLEASTTHLSGSFAVRRGEGLRKGFRGEALVYGDGREVGVGTLVLTDDHGDQVFCSLVGDATREGAQVRATIRGGSGRYEGVEGDFTFLWRFLVKTSEGEVSGFAEKVEGRFRLPAAAPKPRTEGRR